MNPELWDGWQQTVNASKRIMHFLKEIMTEFIVPIRKRQCRLKVLLNKAKFSGDVIG